MGKSLPVCEPQFPIWKKRVRVGHSGGVCVPLVPAAHGLWTGDSGVVDHCLCRNPSGSGEGPVRGCFRMRLLSFSASPHGHVLKVLLSLDPLSGPKRWGLFFFTVKKVSAQREAGLLTQGHTARTRLHKELLLLPTLGAGAVPRQIHPPMGALSSLSLTHK